MHILYTAFNIKWFKLIFLERFLMPAITKNLAYVSCCDTFSRFITHVTCQLHNMSHRQGYASLCVSQRDSCRIVGTSVPQLAAYLLLVTINMSLLYFKMP